MRARPATTSDWWTTSDGARRSRRAGSRDLLTENPRDYLDDSNDRSGRYDIYTADLWLFCEPLAARIGPRWQDGARAALALVDTVAGPDGAAIPWGRSTGVLATALTVELAALAQRPDLHDDRAGAWVRRGVDAFRADPRRASPRRRHRRAPVTESGRVPRPGAPAAAHARRARQAGMGRRRAPRGAAGSRSRPAVRPTDRPTPLVALRPGRHGGRLGPRQRRAAGRGAVRRRDPQPLPARRPRSGHLRDRRSTTTRWPGRRSGRQPRPPGAPPASCRHRSTAERGSVTAPPGMRSRSPDAGSTVPTPEPVAGTLHARTVTVDGRTVVVEHDLTVDDRVEAIALPDSGDRSGAAARRAHRGRPPRHHPHRGRRDRRMVESVLRGCTPSTSSMSTPGERDGSRLASHRSCGSRRPRSAIGTTASCTRRSADRVLELAPPIGVLADRSVDARRRRAAAPALARVVRIRRSRDARRDHRHPRGPRDPHSCGPPTTSRRTTAARTSTTPIYQRWAETVDAVIHHSEWGRGRMLARYRFRTDCRARGHPPRALRRPLAASRARSHAPRPRPRSGSPPRRSASACVGAPRADKHVDEFLGRGRRVRTRRPPGRVLVARVRRRRARRPAHRDRRAVPRGRRRDLRDPPRRVRRARVSLRPRRRHARHRHRRRRDRARDARAGLGVAVPHRDARRRRDPGRSHRRRDRRSPRRAHRRRARPRARSDDRAPTPLRLGADRCRDRRPVRTRRARAGQARPSQPRRTAASRTTASAESSVTNSRNAYRSPAQRPSIAAVRSSTARHRASPTASA